jgi:hypothetical protein
VARAGIVYWKGLKIFGQTPVDSAKIYRLHQSFSALCPPQTLRAVVKAQIMCGVD